VCVCVCVYATEISNHRLSVGQLSVYRRKSIIYNNNNNVLHLYTHLYIISCTRHKRLTVVGRIATTIHPRDDTARPTKSPIFLLSDRCFCLDSLQHYTNEWYSRRIHTRINIIMSVRLIITMCHRGRVNFGRVVNDRRRRPEMEKYNICCCSPRSLLLFEPRGAAAGLTYDLSFCNHLSLLGPGTAPAVGLSRASSAVTRLARRVRYSNKSYAETTISRVLIWPQ